MPTNIPLLVEGTIKYLDPLRSGDPPEKAAPATCLTRSDRSSIGNFLKKLVAIYLYIIFLTSHR
jgi:hypothetical protein